MEKILNELENIKNFKAYAGFGCPDTFTPSITLILFENVPPEAETKRIVVLTLDPFNPRIEKIFNCATKMPQREIDSDEISTWLSSYEKFPFPSFFLVSKYGQNNGYHILNCAITNLKEGKAHADISQTYMHNQMMRAKPIEQFNISEKDMRPLNESERNAYLQANLDAVITHEGLHTFYFTWHAACGFHYSQPKLCLSDFQKILSQFFC